MKTVFFLGHLGTGGAEQQLANLSKGISKKRHDVHVVTLYAGGKHARVFEEYDTVHVESLWRAKSSSSTVNSMKILIAPIRLRRLIDREQPDFIYSMLYLTNFIAWLACLGKFRGRLVWGIRASDMSLNWKRRIPERLGAFLSRSISLIISNSFAGRKHHIAHGYRPVRFSVVPNGVDTEKFCFSEAARTGVRRKIGVGPSNILIGRIARLDPMKDYETFLQAAAYVSNVMSHSFFACIGGGSDSYLRELRDLASSLGVEDRVFWLGDVDDTSGIYSAMDLVVSSSAFGEGSPNTIAEAMSCGVPCVVTNVGDSVNVVNDLGPVIEAGDALGMATAIRTYLESDRPRVPDNRLRESIIEHYSVDKMVSNTIDKLVQING